MKSASPLVALTISFFLNSCIRHYDSFLDSRNKEKIIALQPVGYYDKKQSDFISKELTVFYNRKVIILDPIVMPATFLLSKNDDRYSADSILQLLSETVNDQIIEVVGLTHKDIYTLKKEKNKTANPLWDYSVHGIFGLGFLSGNCCIISDYRFNSPDTNLLKHRLRTVVFHEMGYNIGLDHCTLDQCIMSDQNGKISTLDNSGNDYCDNCKQGLQN